MTVAREIARGKCNGESNKTDEMTVARKIARGKCNGEGDVTHMKQSTRHLIGERADRKKF